MRVYVCKGARGSRMALGGMVGEGRRGKEREQGRAVVVGFGGRNPLRAISGRAVFRGSQNGRRPHQAPPLG